MRRYLKKSLALLLALLMAVSTMSVMALAQENDISNDSKNITPDYESTGNQETDTSSEADDESVDDNLLHILDAEGTVIGEDEITFLSGNAEDNVTCGFSLSWWSSVDTYKQMTVSSRNDDGTNTYTVNFFTNADEAWIDENVEFVIENVTPVAIQDMYREMDVACTSSSVEAESAKSYIDVRDYLGGVYILEPFTEDGPGSHSTRATSGKLLSINTDPGVRVVKVYAMMDGQVLDYVYLGSNGKDSSGSYSEFDLSLNEQVRRIVEGKLWTDDMTNLEKLTVMADYINTTTHYPYTAYVSKEYNPTFWDKWNVDDVSIFYGMFDDVELNQIMKLQGGVTTCQAVQLIQKMATDDLGLTYLYDGTTDTIAEGEGVWRVTGSYSTNPTNPSHESLVYQDADGNRTYLDAQGMGYGGSTKNAACEDHGCLDKIVSLSTIDLSGGTVKLSGTEYTYDGNAKTPTVSVTYDSAALTEGTDFTVAYADNINAGTATVTITGRGDYSGTLTAEFTIAPKTVTASITGNTTKTYDGSIYAPDVELSLSGIISGDDVSVSSSDIEYNDANVGKANTITAYLLTLTGTDADNYVLASNTVSAAGSITKADASVAFADSYTPDKSFDRAAVSLPSESQMILSGVSYSDLQFIWYQDGKEISDAPVNPGNYSLKARAAESENYTAAEAEISFTISKATMTATVIDTSVTYGGELESVRVSYVGSTDLPTSSELEGILKFSTDYAPGAGVGTYTIKISGLTSDYFDIIYVPGTLTVEPRELTVNWSGVTGRVYGDGNSVSAVLNTDNIYGTDDVSIVLTAEKDDQAGTYTASASLTGAKKDNYTLTNDTVSYEVSKKTLNLYFNYDYEKPYDGTTNVDLQLGISGVISGDEVTVSYESAAYNSADVDSADKIIVLGITLGGKDAGNYYVEESATMPAVILPCSLDSLEVQCENDYAYDGVQNAKILIRNGETILTEGTDYTVQYFSGQEEVYALTNVGTYTVEITGVGNYSGTYITDVTVTKAETDLMITVDSKSYDGQPAEVKLSPGYANDDATVIWYDSDGNRLDSAPVHTGHYTVDVTLEETENYTGAEVSTSYVITPAVPTVTLTDLETAYTGEAIQIGAANVTLVNGETYQGTVRYTYFDQNGNTMSGPPVSAGTYTVIAYVDAFGDYTSAESAPATLTILPSSVLNGFAEYNGNWYYYENGRIASDRNDVIQGTVNGQDGWWYIVNGQVQLDFTGLCNHGNAYGWWYVVNGKVDFSKNSVEQNIYGWWYIVGGQVQFDFTGLANYGNAYGWWYIEGGKVNFDHNCVDQNIYGWWYVVGSQVQFGYTGVANYANEYGWWYISGGQVDFSKNSVESNVYGWWYVTGGKVDFGYTGVANYANNYGWWYILNGQVDFNKTSVEPNVYGWWRVVNGQVDFSFNGWARNSYGTWYCVNGKVDFSRS